MKASVRGAEVQIVDAGSRVILDVQAEHWNTSGRLVRDHCYVRWMAKSISLTVRVSPEVRDALERAAKADRRSLAWLLIDKIATDWLIEHGHLPDPHPVSAIGRSQPRKPTGRE